MSPITQSTLLKDLLTTKELAVTKLVAAGHSNAYIGIELGAKAGTIANHLASIFKKSRCANRTQLAAKYLAECNSNA